MMGVAFLFGGFVPNYLAGWLGGYYEAMSPARFWALHGAISLVGAIATWLCAKPLNRVLLGTRNGAGGDKAVQALTDTA
jgi:POT family proton-dependent oligopeptide transporter